MARYNARAAIKDAIAKSLDRQQAIEHQAKMYGVDLPQDYIEGFSQAAQNISNSMNDLVAALKTIPIYNPVITTASTTSTSGYVQLTGTSTTSNSLLVGSSIGTGRVTLTLNPQIKIPQEFLIRRTPVEFLEMIELKSDPKEKETEIIKTTHPEIPMQYWFVGRIKDLFVNHFVDVTAFDCLAGIKEMYVAYKKAIYKIDDCDGLFYGFV